MRYPILLLVSCFLFSCALKKRLYRDGYFVSWHSKKEIKKKGPECISAGKPGSEESLAEKPTDLIQPVASADIGLTPPIGPKKYLASPDSCADMLYLTNGKDLPVTIIEITEEKIRYRLCDNSGAGIKETKKENILFVKYANGTTERFEQEPFEKTPPVHPLAILALSAAIASVFFFILGFADTMFFVLLIGSVLTSAISCVVGRKKILADRDNYRGLKMIKASSRILFILSIVTLIISTTLK